MRSVALASSLGLLIGVPASAQLVPQQNSKPAAAALKDTIPAARDIPYPGTIRLTVDATDVTRAIFRVHEKIPVASAGDVVLLYPKWLPGGHNAANDLKNATGFRFTAGDRDLKWARDTLDVFAFHVDVPEGVKEIDADFQYVSPTEDSQGRILMTPDMENIEFISTSLYPAGYYVRQIPVQAAIIVPSAWKVATALRPTSQSGDQINYPVTSYEILVDSPVIAGAHYRAIPLSADVTLDVIADNEAELGAKPEQIEAHRRLVEQAVRTFGAQHYDHYDFLLTISDVLGGIGFEHHRSSEDGVGRGYFTQWDDLGDRNLLPHEYAHSWDGKFRRPADLWTPDYRTPMQDDLLWVYEGQTQFWGFVIGARSGMLSKQDTLDAFAATAAQYSEGTPGRTWRPLVDTTNDPIIANRAALPWTSWQRSEDYYSEGQLIWLEVDRILREQSGGKRSIDDFAKAFFGVRDRDYGEVTYTFDDVVATLNRLQPYDWRSYFDRKVYSVAPEAPLDWINGSGYRLVYTSEPTKWWKSMEGSTTDLSYSGGMRINREAKVSRLVWGSAAYNAGITKGTEILAVNGKEYSPDLIKTALKDAAGKGPAVKLLIKNMIGYRTVELDWHGGLRYPRLIKIGKGQGFLDALLAPR